MIEISGKLNLDVQDVLNKNGLNDYGYVQKFVDNEFLKHSSKYIPFQTGMLMNLGIAGTVIGSGKIMWLGPYARYMYYEKLMVDPLYLVGAFYDPMFGFWSRPNVSKVVTDIDLNYNGAPTRGGFWGEKVKNNHLEDIKEGVYKIIAQKKG